MIFDRQTVTISVSETMVATVRSMTLPLIIRSMVIILINIISASTALHSSATQNSFERTFSASLSLISPSESARITAIALCEPQLPPVPMSIGMKIVSATVFCSSFSKADIIIPVKVDVSVRSISQGILRQKSLYALCLRYGGGVCTFFLILLPPKKSAEVCFYLTAACSYSSAYHFSATAPSASECLADFL